MLKIKKGDTVVLLIGTSDAKFTTDKDGKKVRKSGKVIQIIPGGTKSDKGSKGPSAIVEGFHTVKKHTKPKGEEEKGTIVNVERPITLSKLALYDEKAGKIIKVGFSKVGDEYVRVNKKDKKPIDKVGAKK
jgi:ribosomal protein L24